MEKSKNYDFFLPSRESDDIVDINQISENFRKIDDEMSEMLKGKGVDQTFKPDSVNPQSGKAIASALVPYLSVNKDTKWLFDGGDASEEYDIEFVVDNEMSDTSNNAVSKKAIKKYVDDVIATLKLEAHPIGSLYFSSEFTSPEELFGGTWERIKDRFILAAGESFPLGSVGGSISHSHDINPEKTFARLYRSENLYFNWKRIAGVTETWTSNDAIEAKGAEKRAITVDGGIGVYGETDNSNNLPPYETYYCWRRIS